jgi:hypothetical protein
MKNAQEIMGENFVGPKEIKNIYGVDSQKFPLVPFNENQLIANKDSHVLIATFPISILNIKKVFGKKIFFWEKSAWYNDEPFAKDRGRIGWELVKKSPTEASTDKTLTEQIKLLKKGGIIPTAQTMVYAIATYYAITDKFLLGQFSVRTSSQNLKGSPVEVGVVREEWIIVNCSSESRKSTLLGLAEAIRSDPFPQKE